MVSFNKKKLDYGELNGRINNLNKIIQSFKPNNTTICINIETNYEAIIGILGVVL